MTSAFTPGFDAFFVLSELCSITKKKASVDCRLIALDHTILYSAILIKWNEVVIMNTDPFKEYIKASEPSKAIKGYAWSTAIGLQAVDGLKTSKYLIDKAIDNIEGKISIKEAQNLIDAYYEEKTEHSVDEERTEEADKVSARIAELLSETAFSF